MGILRLGNWNGNWFGLEGNGGHAVFGRVTKPVMYQ